MGIAIISVFLTIKIESLIIRSLILFMRSLTKRRVPLDAKQLHILDLKVVFKEVKKR